MNKSLLLLLAVVIVDFFNGKEINSQEIRDPLKWPFAQNSIWNMPIGSRAIYVHARIEKALRMGMTYDEDIIVMTPDEPLMEIYRNSAGWNREKDRCIIEGPLLFSAPIPQSFIVSRDSWEGTTPNSGIAVLMPDRRTIKQSQPFAHCTEDKPATSGGRPRDGDIYGDGMYGAHGGSGLSAIGGALRLGELSTESGPLRHALKVNIYAKRNIYYDEETRGFRWPARTSDGYAKDEYYKDRKNPVVRECRMGALLALPPSLDLDSLDFETKPGRMLAQAFRDYGAYIVDDTFWDVYSIGTEWSPQGRFVDEFEKNWGFTFRCETKDSPWARDMDRIFLNLHVVENNGPESIGGGGIPGRPLAPPFPDMK